MGKTVLIGALPTFLPVSNLELQWFLSPGQQPLIHRVSISSEVKSSRCVGTVRGEQTPSFSPSALHLSSFQR